MLLGGRGCGEGPGLEGSRTAAGRLGRAGPGRERQQALRGDPLKGTTFRSGCCLCPGRAEQPWAGHFSIQGLRFPISKMGIAILPTYSGN